MAVCVAVALPVLNGRLFGRVAHGDRDGPLDGGDPTTVGQRAAVGQPVTYGILTLDNTADSAAVIEDVRLVPPPTDGFEVIDILVAGPDRPLAGVADVIGMRLERPGFASFDELHVDYRVGGRRYTGRYRNRYLVCTPVSFEGCTSDLIGSGGS